MKEKLPSFLSWKKGICQGDPVSAYLFILELEIVFAVIKSVKSFQQIKGWNC